MARIARVVVPGLPHHVTQRGNRRQRTFFGEDDFQAYLALLAAWAGKHSVRIWAYCLMDNHVHLIAVPESREGLRRCLGEVHRRYTLRVNEREDWRGHLWQGRFSSFPMDERHLFAAARYIEMNPVAAGIVRKPGDYPWSSARAHLSGRGDGIVDAAALLSRRPDWEAFLDAPQADAERKALISHEQTGRPLGSERFVAGVESTLGRNLRGKERGRPTKEPLLRSIEPMMSIVSPNFGNN